MDSGNSGSIKSSSGGDEEYDSSTNRPHHQQDHSFLHPSLDPQLLPHPSLYEPSPSHFLAFSQPTSLLNLTRPDHGCSDLGSLTAANAYFSGQPALGTTQVLSDHQTTAATSSHGPSAGPPGPGPIRNPKKRTRASRRAPTTVLTTDTSNFRAMVQEFTGIPAPPFAASPYSRTRLDLFGSSSTGSSIIRSDPSHFDPMRTYGSNIGLNPLRPSPQKYQSPNSNNINPNSATSNSSFNLIDPASSSVDHILRRRQQQQPPQNMLNMQNQVLPFQSFMNPEMTHPLHPLGANKSPFEELGSLGHGLAGNIWRDSGGSTQDHEGSQRGDQRQHFHHDKGLEGANSNVPSRGEGTLDSWIFPAD